MVFLRPLRLILQVGEREGAMIRIIPRAIDEKGSLTIPARTLSPDANLCRAGLTPFVAVQVMLALEQELKVEFPKRMLNRQSMSSINAIRSRICELQRTQAQLEAA